MKSGFNAGFVVVLVLLVSSFETHARKATDVASARLPAARSASLGGAPAQPPLNNPIPAARPKTCDRPAGPAAVAEAARTIAQVAGAPVAASAVKTAAVSDTARVDGAGISGVREVRALAAAPTSSPARGETAAAGGETDEVLRMPDFLYAKGEDGDPKLVQMVVGDLNRMEAVLANERTRVPASELARIIHEAAQNVVWVNGGSGGNGTGFVVDHNPIVDDNGIVGSEARTSNGCYVVTAQHVLAKRRWDKIDGKEVLVIESKNKLNGQRVSMGLGKKTLVGTVLGCGAKALDGAVGIISSRDFCVVKLDRPSGVHGLQMAEVSARELGSQSQFQMFSLGFIAPYNPEGGKKRVLTAAPVCNGTGVTASFDALRDEGLLTSCLVGFGASGGPGVAVKRNGAGTFDVEVVGLAYSLSLEKEAHRPEFLETMPPGLNSNLTGSRPGASGSKSPFSGDSLAKGKNMLTDGFFTPLVDRDDDGIKTGVITDIVNIIADDLESPKATKCL